MRSTDSLTDRSEITSAAEELAAALDSNKGCEATYRRLGATIIDGARTPQEVADAILAAAKSASVNSR